MLNTLGLDDDLDPVEALIAIEKAFDVEFSDPQAEAIRTVGDTYDLLLKKISSDKNNRKCASAMAFYRLRGAIGHEGSKVAPVSALTLPKDTSAKRYFRELEQRTGLNLPKADPSWVGYFAMPILVLCVIAPMVLLPATLVLPPSLKVPADVVVWSWLLAFVMGCTLAYVDPGRIPEDCRTLAGLAKRTAVLSHGRLVKLGAHTNEGEAWNVLVTILSDFTSLPADQIGRETYFLQSTYNKAKTAA